jgi:hypothetical protein
MVEAIREVLNVRKRRLLLFAEAADEMGNTGSTSLRNAWNCPCGSEGR